MRNRLPGQKMNMSSKLQDFVKQAKTECKRNIEFTGVSLKGFLGRTEWRHNDILVEIDSNLTCQIAEYIAAHELSHVLQLARGCAIASGRVDEPDAVTVATKISDFVYDPFADSIAVDYGFPMTAGFKNWLESETLLDAIKRPHNGRRYGNNWNNIWRKLTEVRVCRNLGLKLPKRSKDFWTLYVALDLAKVIQRASNLGLSEVVSLLNNANKVPMLSKVVNDLVAIGSASNVEESELKLINIYNYFEIPPGHIVINKPLTGERLIKGQWRISANEELDY